MYIYVCMYLYIYIYIYIYINYLPLVIMHVPPFIYHFKVTPLKVLLKHSCLTS